MWPDGIMHCDNPLSNGEIDDEPCDVECVSDDPYGSTPLNSDNNVVVQHIDLRQNDSLQ